MSNTNVLQTLFLKWVMRYDREHPKLYLIQKLVDEVN